MKKLIPFIILTFNLFLLHSCFKANDNIGHDGRCTGSAYCTACSNCSRCGHCSSGGTCSVCNGSYADRTASYRSSSKKSTYPPDSYKSSKTQTNKSPKVFIDKVNNDANSDNVYIVGITATNIYKKPSFKSKVITTISKNTQLIKLSKEGSWYNVQVKSNGKKGYVYYKDVK